MSGWMRSVIAGLTVLLLAAPVLAQDKVEYYHVDAVGSVRAVTDSTGTVVARHDFFPFGEEYLPPPQTSDATRFTGKEHDTETGLDYFGARYYRSTAARFTTVDPVYAWSANLADPQLWNRYAYVRNNPLRYTDPDGRCIWDLCIAEVAAAIGVSEAAVAVGYAAIGTVAYLSSEPGKQAVRGVTNDTGMMITTAAGAIGSWFSTEKRPGKLGKPDHQATAAEEAARIGGKREHRILTPNGAKGYRVLDAANVDGNNNVSGETVNVYRPTKTGGIPKRENDAADDVEKVTGRRPTLVPVRPVPKKDGGSQ